MYAKNVKFPSGFLCSSFVEGETKLFHQGFLLLKEAHKNETLRLVTNAVARF